ncbi:MAG TPA: HTH domain-containing protein [Nitrososphaerales archaeon]|nr:HTH domain-containing protein [Nitrososphaerales archaeon]
MNLAEDSRPVDLGDQKKNILWQIKMRGEVGLEDLSRILKISRMAVHKHLSSLEERGLVESREVMTGNVGRPRTSYRLTEGSKAVFPKSYSQVAVCALDFIERKMGRKGVEQVLRERQSEIFEKYKDAFDGLELDQKVKRLAKLRDSEGYMAEAKKNSSGKYVMLEHNCPIIYLAQDYWEACTTETELFEKLLDAKVEATHRAAKGDLVCRFTIEEKKE